MRDLIEEVIKGIDPKSIRIAWWDELTIYQASKALAEKFPNFNEAKLDLESAEDEHHIIPSTANKRILENRKEILGSIVFSMGNEIYSLACRVAAGRRRPVQVVPAAGCPHPAGSKSVQSVQSVVKSHE
jgi:hypothetical protein